MDIYMQWMLVAIGTVLAFMTLCLSVAITYLGYLAVYDATAERKRCKDINHTRKDKQC